MRKHGGRARSRVKLVEMTVSRMSALARFLRVHQYTLDTMLGRRRMPVEPRLAPRTTWEVGKDCDISGCPSDQGYQ